MLLYTQRLDMRYSAICLVLSRAFFKDFPVGGGAFFEKEPFCEIIY